MSAIDTEVAIVGGGLVGAAIAYGMRALGARLVVLDEGDRALRAARGNFGLVWVQGKGRGAPAYAHWTLASSREWPRLASELAVATGIDVALRQPGGVHLCLSARELDARVAALAALAAQPGFPDCSVAVEDRDALARRLPGLGPSVVGGTYCAQDGDCNPLRLLQALHAALAQAGCRYLPGCAVASIDRAAGGFLLRTPAADVAARRVVLAAGLGNAALAPMVGLSAPVHANKGHVVVLERVQPFLPLPVETLRQTDDGTVLIGDSQQEGGDDATLDPAILAAMAARAVAAFPRLAGRRVVRAWAALRVMSPDGLPIYAASRTHEGAFVATCHSGVTLAAAHAHVLAPALLAGGLPDACAAFSPERFGVCAGC